MACRRDGRQGRPETAERRGDKLPAFSANSDARRPGAVASFRFRRRLWVSRSPSLLLSAPHSGRGDRPKGGGGGVSGRASFAAEAPSTALRAVPLPRFAGQDRGATLSPS